MEPMTFFDSRKVNRVGNGTMAIIGMMLAGTGSVYSVEHVTGWRSLVQSRVPFTVGIFDEAPDWGNQQIDTRTIADHVQNIRSILNLSVSEIAGLFNVSRQAVYKWLSEDSSPELDKAERILQLSQIADQFRDAGVSRAGVLVQMKAFDGGRSLIDLFQSGEYRIADIQTLIDEAKAMESSYRKSGLATSKAKPTNDWQATVSVPGYIE